jgi:hypothetical protein
MSEFVTVQNFVSEHLKSYTDDGQVVELGPRGGPLGVAEMTTEEFEALQADYGDKVGLVNRGAQTVSKLVVQPVHKAWVANMTGNPDAPDEVMGMNMAGQYVVPEPNPNKAPRTLYIQRVGFGEDNQRNNEGIYIRKMIPGREVSVEPFQQIEVTQAEATSFGRIDDRMPDSHCGATMISRDISDLFQLPLSASLDELRAHLEMMPEGGPNFPAGKNVLGESEGEIRERLAGADKKVIAKAINDAKVLTWKRITLRLFNPRVRVPTEKQYLAFVSKKLPKGDGSAPAPKKAKKPDSEVSALLEDL